MLLSIVCPNAFLILYYYTISETSMVVRIKSELPWNCGISIRIDKFNKIDSNNIYIYGTFIHSLYIAI